MKGELQIQQLTQKIVTDPTESEAVVEFRMSEDFPAHTLATDAHWVHAYSFCSWVHANDAWGKTGGELIREFWRDALEGRVFGFLRMKSDVREETIRCGCYKTLRPIGKLS